MTSKTALKGGIEKMNLFLAPESWPFLLALILLLAVAVVEGLALLCGFSVSGWMDDFVPDPSADAAGHVFDSCLGWLHIGQVPMLVVVTILLTAFAVIGFVINGVVHSFVGFYPPAITSAPLAFLGTLPIVRMTSTTIARFVPRIETSAEPLENLVGRVGVVVNGTARANYPAQARVKNDHGQTLYVHVEPDGEGLQLAEGESVLLVKQISGTRFLAIANPRPELL
ncbi:MAG: YqiJ family protein [Candidatus Accumulibacter sp.]|nr:YqiJ family protein [Accumulibacter sp.]